ncbi:hypothetical protein LEP3755_35790 [Leptolyngbya sp. NIES-3755]|nr:hypothetical protein LEP3755_35790 [Leptolyngbya sp. NIES-3755]
MVLSRVRYRKRLRTSKEWAVATTLFLIFAAFVLSRWLSKTFENDSGLELVYAGLMLAFSWDMVHALVVGAIEDAKDKELKERDKTQTSEGVLERQNWEYYALIEKNVPLRFDFKRGNPSLKLWSDSSHLELLEDSLAHDEIGRALGDEDELLQNIALRACLEALGKQDASNEEIKNMRLELFCQDIYVYLKAWLMISIRNRREMPFCEIRQRYPNEASPKKEYYVKAIRYVRNHLVDRPSVANLLREEHRERAKKILKDYLSKLIARIETNSP